jgi:hypothetical protein
VELQAATYPKAEWVPLRSITGRLYRFLDEDAAKAELARLQKVQPHAVFRIVAG